MSRREATKQKILEALAPVALHPRVIAEKVGMSERTVRGYLFELVREGKATETSSRAWTGYWCACFMLRVR